MPQPIADSIILSERQKDLLSQIVRAHTNSHRLVQRAQVILLADLKMTNTEIALSLQLSRGRVRLWRTFRACGITITFRIRTRRR